VQGHNITLELLGPNGTAWLVRDQIVSSLIPDKWCVSAVAAMACIDVLLLRLRTTRVGSQRLQSTQNAQVVAEQAAPVREVDRTTAKNLSL